MKIIFFGTPDYVVPIAEGLLKEFRTAKEKGIVAVVTQPPKPAGRDKRIEYSPVDTWAYKHGIQIFHNFDGLPEADLGVVAAYGKIIPKSVINHFPKGILNIHPSLLPKYRGASPIQAAIVNGETETGVSVIKMDELMDHGPIVSSFKEEILPNDTNETLRTKLFNRSLEFLIDLIPNYISGKINLKAQDHEKATFTKIMSKDDGLVNDVYKDPELTLRMLRAFEPWPGVWTLVTPSPKQEPKRLKIRKASLEEGKLVLKEVQLEGKKTVSWEEFQRGYPKASLGA